MTHALENIMWFVEYRKRVTRVSVASGLHVPTNTDSASFTLAMSVFVPIARIPYLAPSTFDAGAGGRLG